MKYNISDNRLKVIIDTLGEEYKDLLIEKILDELKESDADLINASDLIRLDVSVKASLKTDKKTTRMNRMMSLLSSVGIVYALMGLVLLMASELEHTIRDDPMMMISVVLIVMGLFVALFSLLFKNTSKIMMPHYQRGTQSVSPYQLINKWKEIEALINELTPREIDSLSAMIANLSESGIINHSDVEIINKMLLMRNIVVHEKNPKLPKEEDIRFSLQQADKLISKLKKLL